MRVLVTGGAGFIGSYVVRALLERGDEVVVLDSFEEQVHGISRVLRPQGPRGGGLSFYVGRAGEPEILRPVLRGCDAIVHLAAVVGVGQSMYEIGRYVQANSLETAILLEEILRMPSAPRVVVASSMSCYGEGAKWCEHCGISFSPGIRSTARLVAQEWEVPCTICGGDSQAVSSEEGDALRPTSAYAITKRDQEELVLMIGAAHGVPALALRFFNVYGPGQALSNPYTGAAAIFAARLLNGSAPIVFEDGKQERDFVHVEDVARAVLLAVDSDVEGAVLNIGTGCPTRIGWLAEVLANEIAHEIEPEYTGEYRAGDIRHCFADTAAAESVLGFKARVAVDVGMRQLAQHLAKERPEARDRVGAHVEDLRARGLVG